MLVCEGYGSGEWVERSFRQRFLIQHEERAASGALLLLEQFSQLGMKKLTSSTSIECSTPTSSARSPCIESAASPASSSSGELSRVGCDTFYLCKSENWKYIFCRC